MKKLITICLLIFTIFLVAEEAGQLNSSDKSAFPVAVVLKAKGDLILIRDKQELACPVGTALENSDKVRANDNSLALIKFVDNSSQIRLFSNSEVEINVTQEEGSLSKNIRLEGGSILSTVNNKIVGKYSVSTTSTIASVRGTQFLVELMDKVTKVTGFTGKVEVQNKKTGAITLVTKGNTAISHEDGALDRQETGKLDPEVEEEMELQKLENNLRIEFENKQGDNKTIILEY